MSPGTRCSAGIVAVRPVDLSRNTVATSEDVTVERKFRWFCRTISLLSEAEFDQNIENHNNYFFTLSPRAVVDRKMIFFLRDDYQ